MKRLIFATIVAISLLAGCGKEETETPRYIVFRDELGLIETMQKQVSGLAESKAEVTLNEYYRNQRVNLITINAPEKGKSYFFKPNKRTEYVTARVYVYAKNTLGNETTLSEYIANAFYIEEDGNTLIILKPDTMLSKLEPKLQ